MSYSTSLLNHNEDKIIKDEKMVEPADSVSQLNSTVSWITESKDKPWLSTLQ